MGSAVDSNEESPCELSLAYLLPSSVTDSLDVNTPMVSVYNITDCGHVRTVSVE